MEMRKEGDYIPIATLNDFCDESHFNVSLIVRDKVTRRCPLTTAVEEESRRGFESSSLCLPA